jgi:predicted acylesterase/phospholipase RssA
LDFALDCSVARRSRTSRLTNPAAGAGLIGKNPLYFEEGSAEDEDLIGLSFSGGGTRAAAFSFGVLTEMARTPVRGASASMLDRIGFISGVSGGAVTAAYYSLRKRAALDDFRERFLLRNAEEGLETDLTIGTVGKALAGGIDERSIRCARIDRRHMGRLKSSANSCIHERFEAFRHHDARLCGRCRRRRSQAALWMVLGWAL